MKKIFLLLLLPVCSWAQFSKGNVFLGGSLGVNNQNGNTTSSVYSLTQNFSINPTVGFMLADNLAIGVRLGYSDYAYYYQNTFQKSADQETLSGGLFVRRFFSISEKFLFALDGGVNYGRSTTNYKYNSNPYGYGDSSQKSYSVTAQVVPTFLYLPSNHWGIEASIGSLYFTHSYNFINEINANTFNLNYGSFSLGFAYYIR